MGASLHGWTKNWKTNSFPYGIVVLLSTTPPPNCKNPFRVGNDVGVESPSGSVTPDWIAHVCCVGHNAKDTLKPDLSGQSVQTHLYKSDWN